MQTLTRVWKTESIADRCNALYSNIYKNIPNILAALVFLKLFNLYLSYKYVHNLENTLLFILIY